MFLKGGEEAEVDSFSCLLKYFLFVQTFLLGRSFCNLSPSYRAPSNIAGTNAVALVASEYIPSG